MDRTQFVRIRIAATAAVALTICSLLVWQVFNGGVPSHSFMARDDMPSISNWWGALTLPTLTWFALGNIGGRLAAGRVTERAAQLGVLSGLLFGAVLATAFELKYNDVPAFQLGAIPVLALFVPLYRVEYLLGFVLAMAYTFGGVLPLIIGTVLTLVGALLYLTPRWVLGRFRMKR